MIHYGRRFRWNDDTFHLPTVFGDRNTCHQRHQADQRRDGQQLLQATLHRVFPDGLRYDRPGEQIRG